MKSRLKLEHLKAFVAVAEAGELADAGTRMGRTPAALSMTLKQIEEDLGGPLFEGERKGRLTPLGAYSLEKARRALAEFDNALLNMQHFSRGEAGVARVAAVPSAATRLMSTAVQRLRQALPAVRIELRDIDSSAVAEAVAMGAVDFGIASLTDAGRGLKYERLLEDPFVLLCPAHHPLTRLGRPIRWSDIDVREFIANGLCSHMESPEVANLVDQSSLVLRNTTSLLTFVERGFGVTVLPLLAAPAGGALQSLPLADTEASRKLEVFTRHGETLNPAAAALLRVAREVAAELRLTL
jgi:LysR family transcriptional regulator, carnitine catabolism transcriptional activator